MDPNAAIARLWDAINETDLLTARDTLNDLEDWISIGGFVPEAFYEAFDAYLALEQELAEFIDYADA